MPDQFSTPQWLARMAALESPETLRKIAGSNVLCVGLGGVGGLAAELVARLGVGAMTIVDGDAVDETNLNRQIVALTSSVAYRFLWAGLPLLRCIQRSSWPRCTPMCITGRTLLRRR